MFHLAEAVADITIPLAEGPDPEGVGVGGCGRRLDLCVADRAQLLRVGHHLIGPVPAGGDILAEKLL